MAGTWAAIARKPIKQIRKVLDMIPLTGGAGYIGSHVCMALLDAGLDVVAGDNLSNSNEASLQQVQPLCGRSLVFRNADIRDEEAIYEILRSSEVIAVVHPAGLKAVGDSNVRPMSYCDNNVVGTRRLVTNASWATQRAAHKWELAEGAASKGTSLSKSITPS